MNFVALLPLAIIALCPIMMYVMMRGHGHDSHTHSDHKNDDQAR